MTRNWTREEVLVTFNLYCKTPFGRLHRSNPDIVALANALGRTPSAVAMKLVNLASLDPVQQFRQIRGLQNASALDKSVWDQFLSNPTEMAVEMERASSQIGIVKETETLAGVSDDDVYIERPTSMQAVVQVRLAQRFFRNAVLASYNFKCAICSLDILELLNASHIIPWSVDERRRADPRNGLSMCVLHDRTFDRGLMSVDSRLRVMVSSTLRQQRASVLWSPAFAIWHEQPINLPERFHPDEAALDYHRSTVFRP